MLKVKTKYLKKIGSDRYGIRVMILEHIITQLTVTLSLYPLSLEIAASDSCLHFTVKAWKPYVSVGIGYE